MASFNMVGLEGLERLFAGHAALLDDVAPELLKAGTDVLTEYMVGSIAEHDLIDSGDLLDSIKAGPVREGEDGYYQEVWPQGKDHKGVSNAKKGFIHEYGSSRSDNRKEKDPARYGKTKSGIPATHWMSEAAEAAAPEVSEAMREVWNDNLERND